jgi:hypothetical protein
MERISVSVASRTVSCDAELLSPWVSRGAKIDEGAGGGSSQRRF